MTTWSAGHYGLWLWVLLISMLNSASAQEPGYISIDCGATSNFTDPVTKIKWTTDASYISTGINKILDGSVTTVINDKQVKTLRYFPADRSRHCYTLPAAPNTTFLVRASFLHGGFQPSVDNSFNISIGSTIVDGVDWSTNEFDTFIVGEYIFKTDITSDSVVFCLIPNGTPAFVNALELRPLDPDMYTPVVQNGEYLKFLLRYNCGAAATDPTVRYPDDPYDRAWYVPDPSSFSDWPTGKTSRNIPTDDVWDRPPLAVLQSAWDSTSWFWWVYTPSDYELGLTQTFYVNLYFAEVDVVGPSDLRKWSVDVNGFTNVFNLSGWTGAKQLFGTHFKIPSTGANFSFAIFPDATLGPVLNAAEIYSVRAVDSRSTATADVSALETFKSLLGLSSWTGDPCFPVPYSWITCDQKTTSRVITIKLSNYNLTGTIPASVADLTALTDLWLDNNEITGSIPDLTKLTKLTTLHLQNNLLSGAIPETLASLTSLKEVWLSNNQLSGPIPAALYNRKDNGLNLKTDGNKKLCGPTENCKVVAPVPISHGGGGGSKLAPIIGGVVGGVVAMIVIVGLLAFCFCRKSPLLPVLPVTSPAFGDTNTNHTGASIASAASGNSVSSGAAAVKQARPFTLQEVELATNNYKDQIGVGGYGPVYYGRLTDGSEVAVKLNSDTSKQGKTEFLNEVSFLSRVHHKNLVSLFGYCEEGGNHILLYEFMSCGTLREHLYGKDMLSRISWRQRLDIALNAAKGLEYLHNDCLPRIIHRDIKSNNILLNDKLLAKVADFGISKSSPEDETGGTGVSTLVKGTTGYLDPEYYSHGKLTQKSDVFSFGVVLLEMICGRPPVLQKFTDPREHMLVEWARGQMNSNSLESIIDPHIRGTYNREAMWKLAELAMDCVEPYGVNRPDMNQVVRALIIAVELEDQATQAYAPPQPWAGRERKYSADSVDYPLTYSTDSRPHPPAEGSFIHIPPTYPPNGVNPSAPPGHLPPQDTFSSVSLDPETDSAWINPQPR